MKKQNKQKINKIISILVAVILIGGTIVPMILAIMDL